MKLFGRNRLLYSLIIILIGSVTFMVIKNTMSSSLQEKSWYSKLPEDDNYRHRVARTLLAYYASGIKVYYDLNHLFPQGNANPKNLLEQGGVYHGHNKSFNFPPDDPWGTEISYALVSNNAVLRSAGKDKLFNSSDDIVFVVLTNNTGAIVQSEGEKINSAIVEKTIMRWTLKPEIEK